MSRRAGGTSVLGRARVLVAACVLACVASPSLAQPGSPAGSPDDGGLFQWSTVNLSGNAPYLGNPGNLPAFGIERDLLLGRGAVAAPFRISRTELTHSQYIGFLNAINGNPATRPQLAAYFQSRGVSIDQSGTLPPGFNFQNGPNGTQTYTLRNPGWANVPVQVTWRVAALYCNWMHNGRTGTAESFLTGAYNVASWGDVAVPGGLVFTDDAARMPGARFFIPNLDESIAAAHWDPNRNGPNQGGYWLYGYSSDTAPVYGTPGDVDPLGRPVTATLTIAPVASIPNLQSPWGLWDSVGSMREWTEQALSYTDQGALIQYGRVWRGDSVSGLGWNNVYNVHNATLRIASIIPSPSVALTIGAFGVLRVSRRRR